MGLVESMIIWCTIIIMTLLFTGEIPEAKTILFKILSTNLFLLLDPDGLEHVGELTEADPVPASGGRGPDRGEAAMEIPDRCGHLADRGGGGHEGILPLVIGDKELDTGDDEHHAGDTVTPGAEDLQGNLVRDTGCDSWKTSSECKHKPAVLKLACHQQRMRSYTVHHGLGGESEDQEGGEDDDENETHDDSHGDAVSTLTHPQVGGSSPRRERTCLDVSSLETARNRVNET